MSLEFAIQTLWRCYIVTTAFFAIIATVKIVEVLEL